MQSPNNIRHLLIIVAIIFTGCSSNMNDIEFYEASDQKIQMLFLNCACSHKGYYVIDNKKIFWFIPVHKSVQLLGEITDSTPQTISYLATDKKKYMIERLTSGLHFHGPKDDFKLTLSAPTKELRDNYVNLKFKATK